MDNKKQREPISLVWIAMLIIGTIITLMSFVVLSLAKIDNSEHSILVLPFLIIGIILTICGLIALVYNMITKKTLDSRITRCVILEIIGCFWVIMPIVLYVSEKSLAYLSLILFAIIFIVEGIRITINSFKDKHQLERIRKQKQLSGYKGLTAVSWWFAYLLVLIGLALTIYCNLIIYRIIGIVCILLGLLCYVKKIIFYIKYNMSKERKN